MNFLNSLFSSLGGAGRSIGGGLSNMAGGLMNMFGGNHGGQSQPQAPSGGGQSHS